VVRLVVEMVIVIVAVVSVASAIDADAPRQIQLASMPAVFGF
jgi:hypothetical protein